MKPHTAVRSDELAYFSFLEIYTEFLVLVTGRYTRKETILLNCNIVISSLETICDRYAGYLELITIQCIQTSKYDTNMYICTFIIG